VQKPATYVVVKQFLETRGAMIMGEPKDCLVDAEGNQLHLDKHIASGAHATIYPVQQSGKSTDAKTPQRVLKILELYGPNESEKSAGLANEVDAQTAAAKLGIAPELYDSWLCKDGQEMKGFILMERLDATTVGDLMRAGVFKGKPTLLLKVLSQLLAAVEKLKQAGWLHHDLNSDNVMVNKDLSRLWMIDFGAAIRISQKHHKVVPNKEWSPETKWAVERKLVSDPITPDLETDIGDAFLMFELYQWNGDKLVMVEGKAQMRNETRLVPMVMSFVKLT